MKSETIWLERDCSDLLGVELLIPAPNLPVRSLPGVPYSLRKQIIESFEIPTIRVRVSTFAEYGIRYYDNINAFEKGRFLFETFPASQQSLAIKREWNQMTRFRQWQIRPGTTIIEGRAAPQGQFLPGGQIQKFVLSLEDLMP
ncbi:MAG: hypothetical protein WHS45_12380 [Anaerolinea sp.]|jgi:hypothetical protein